MGRPESLTKEQREAVAEQFYSCASTSKRGLSRKYGVSVKTIDKACLEFQNGRVKPVARGRNYEDNQRIYRKEKRENGRCKESLDV